MSCSAVLFPLKTSKAMEEIIPILAISVIYFVVYVVRNLSPSRKDAAGEERTFGESFPTVEILEPAQDASGHVAAPPKSRRKVAPDVASNATTTAASKDKAAAAVATEPASPKESHAKKVPLSTKSDAKRAFIYSEIFNRKY